MFGIRSRGRFFPLSHSLFICMFGVCLLGLRWPRMVSIFYSFSHTFYSIWAVCLSFPLPTVPLSVYLPPVLLSFSLLPVLIIDWSHRVLFFSPTLKYVCFSIVAFFRLSTQWNRNSLLFIYLRGLFISKYTDFNGWCKHKCQNIINFNIFATIWSG